jgi:type II secretory pathway component GspD/PulD (secretin)
LANIPDAGYAFGRHNDSLQDTEFMILVTPRRLRSPVRQARNILAGRGDPSSRGSLGAGVPTPQPPALAPVNPNPNPLPQAPAAPPPGPNPNPNPPEF